LESKFARVDAELLAPAEPIRPSTFVRLLLMPVAFVGAIVHWPLYRLIGVLAKRYASAEDEMVATVKIVAGLVFFPLQWIALAALTAFCLGAVAGGIVLITQPLIGYAALMAFEALDEFRGRWRAMRRHDVHRQQREIREEILAVASQLP
jgi:hypothetical protein